jgi:hypothetical protein
LTAAFSADGNAMNFALRIFLTGMALTAGSAFPDPGAGSTGQHPSLFITADRCMACHNGLTTASGKDVSIGTDWRPSMMANSAKDPYWQAAVRREILDHAAAAPAIENECSICHMPMARFESKTAGSQFRIFSNLMPAPGESRAVSLAIDGVSCTSCHQVEDKGLGEKKSFTGGFAIDIGLRAGNRPIYGPYEVDEGRRTVMQSSTGFMPAQSSHISSSELCATCHTLYTHTMDSSGNVIGELPEQVPYLEWRHSGYSPNRECQSCHLPAAAVPMPISSVLGQQRSRLAQHVFRGGNFFMARVFNRYRDSLDATALPQEFNASARRTIEHLETSAARVGIHNLRSSAGRLSAEVEIMNLAGHKLPTAYPSRRAWIHFSVRNRQGKIIFESGSPAPDGSICGNDNDMDAGRYEPHYEEIDDPEKVQIYEAIMIDSEGKVTTGLLQGLRYVKDNRLLPRGFDKAKAGRDIAARGRAQKDDDFKEAGDRIRYSLDLKQSAGPYTIQVELWYQPIGFRWAQNLGGREAEETKRFVAFYDSMADASGIVLARATAVLP